MPRLIELGILLEAHDKASKEVKKIAETIDGSLKGALLGLGTVAVGVGAGLAVLGKGLYDVAKFGAETAREVEKLGAKSGLTSTEIALMTARADAFDAAANRAKASVGLWATEITDKVTPALEAAAVAIRDFDLAEAGQRVKDIMTMSETDFAAKWGAVRDARVAANAQAIESIKIDEETAARHRLDAERELLLELQREKDRAREKRLAAEAAAEAHEAKRRRDAAKKAAEAEQDELMAGAQKIADVMIAAKKDIQDRDERKADQRDSERLAKLKRESEDRENEVKEQILAQAKAHKRVEDAAKSAGQAGMQFGSQVAGALGDAIFRARDLEESLKALGEQLVESLFSQLIATGFGAIFAGIGGIFAGGTFGGGVKAFFGAHSGGQVPGFAGGGQVGGGFPGRDSVLARLEPGEVVIPTHVVRDVQRGVDPTTKAGSSGGLTIVHVHHAIRPPTMAEQDRITRDTTLPSLRRLGASV